MRIPEHEAERPLREGRSEEQDHRRGVSARPEHGALRAGGVEDGPHVVHLNVERRDAAGPVGQPRPTLVEQDHARELGERASETGAMTVLSPELQVLEEVRQEQQVDRPTPDNLVGDVRAAATCITDLGRWLHGQIVRPVDAAGNVGRAEAALRVVR
jgi:hypothetical protein